MISYTFPWPDKALSPNARNYWNKNKAVIPARNLAFLTVSEGTAQEFQGEQGPLQMRMVFYPPNRRHYDLDGLITRCKAYQDGIFLRLGLDDHLITEIVARRCAAVPGGKVVIEIRRMSE